MAGYSGTPLHKKLGLKEGGQLALVGAPRGWSVELPDRARSSRRQPASLAAGTKEDVVLAFFRGRAELETDLPTLGRAIFPDGALWIAWPRRAGGHDSDIREDGIRELALPLGLVDVKVAALDEDWSALRLVWRRENRTRPPAGAAPG
jgi:hypothetical protein